MGPITSMDTEVTSSNSESAEDDNSEFDSHDDEFPKLFYVNDKESVDTVIRRFECKTNSNFTTLTSTKYFGSCQSIYSEGVNHNVLFVDKFGNRESIPYDGVPFFVIGHRTMVCKFRKKHNAKQLEREKEERRERGAKTRKKVTVKMAETNCPARIRIREVHKFPDFKIECNTSDFRDKASHNLNEALKKRKVVGERRFYIRLPRWADHKGHKLTQSVTWKTDNLVLKKIHEFMKQGIVDSGQMQKVTYDYVRNELFNGTEVPPETDSRYFPPKRRIISLLSKWKRRIREKENNGLMSMNAGGMLPLLGDPTDEGGEKEAAVSGDRKEKGDDDRLPSSHENNSMESALAMTEFNSHYKSCQDFMDHIKNLLILSGDRKVACHVKNRLEKLVKDLENIAKIEGKRSTEQDTSEGICADSNSKTKD